MTSIDVGPAQVDLLRIRAGDKNQFNIKLTDNNGAVNLSEAAIAAQARVTPTDDVIAVSAVIEMVDAVGGQFIMRWPGEDVRIVLNGEAQWSGVWDLQMTEEGEDPQTLVAGKFTIESDVTRDE